MASSANRRRIKFVEVSTSSVEEDDDDGEDGKGGHGPREQPDIGRRRRAHEKAVAMEHAEAAVALQKPSPASQSTTTSISSSTSFRAKETKKKGRYNAWIRIDIPQKVEKVYLVHRQLFPFGVRGVHDPGLFMSMSWNSKRYFAHNFSPYNRSFVSSDRIRFDQRFTFGDDAAGL